MLAELGHIPHPGEAFVHDGRRYTVLTMDKLRIVRVKIEALSPASSHEVPQEAQA